MRCKGAVAAEGMSQGAFRPLRPYSQKARWHFGLKTSSAGREAVEACAWLVARRGSRERATPGIPGEEQRERRSDGKTQGRETTRHLSSAVFQSWRIHWQSVISAGCPICASRPPRVVPAGPVPAGSHAVTPLSPAVPSTLPGFPSPLRRAAVG